MLIIHCLVAPLSIHAHTQQSLELICYDFFYFLNLRLRPTSLSVHVPRLLQ